MIRSLSRRAAAAAAGCLLGIAAAQAPALEPADLRPRLIVETDLGGDKDDQGSLVRLLMFSDQFEIEAILLDRADSRFLADGLAWNPSGAATTLEMGRDYLAAWNQLRPNMVKHSARFPTYQHLYDNMVFAPDSTNAGRDRLIAIVDRDDPRPVWYGNWGSNSGTTSNLKRALDHVKATRSQADYERFARRLRIATLDGSGRTRQEHEAVIKLHIATDYPDINGRWYHRFQPIHQSAGGFDYLRDLRAGHGQLGAWYPGTKEGDSFAFVYLQSQTIGLGIPTRTTWGGWGGRYATQRTGSYFPNGAFWWNANSDTWNGTTNRDNTAARFAADIQHHFAARVDWGQASTFAGANHAPVAVVNGDASGGVLRLFARPGQQIALNAAGSSDPDGDSLAYQWIRYDEADSYAGAVAIAGASSAAATVTVPGDAGGKEIHCYLEVSDQRDATPANGRPSLKAYRRVVIVVRDQLKVLCLGDSITDGSHKDQYPGAYRIRLWELMQQKGWNIDLVGSKANGPATIDRDHEGWIGYRIDELLGSTVGLAARLDSARPDVVLLIVGTNDAYQDSDLANADHRYLQLLQLIQDRRPEALVVFATVPPMSDSARNARAVALNAQLPRVEVAAYHIGLWARLVDLHGRLTTADLADGVHPDATGYAKIAEVFAEALAAAGVSGGGSVVNQPPTVALTAPVADTDLTAPATVALAATAADSDGSIAKVEFFAGATKVGEDASAPYAVTWSDAPAGSHRLTARATDDLGATTTSAAVDVTVKAAPSADPVSGLPAKFQKATLAVGSAVYTDRSFTVQSVGAYGGAVQIRTPNSDKAVTATAGYLAFSLTAAAEVLVAYDSRATALPTWLGGWTATGETLATSDVPFRLYRRTFAAGSTVDLGGNAAAGAAGAGSNYWVIVRADAVANQPPSVALTAPAAGASFTAPAEIALAASAADSDGSVAKVEFFAGGTKLGEDASAPFAFTWSGAAAGSYSLTARATDDRGATTTSAAVAVTVAAAADAIAINFQPASAPTVAGWLVDSGLVYASRHGRSYGWNVSNDTTRDRNVLGDQLRDTLIHLQKTAGLRWELAIPDGTYDVTLVCGDPSFTDSINTLGIEGVVQTDPDGNDGFDEHRARVTVSDGRLTIEPVAGSVNAKLSFIEVVPVPAGNG